MTVMAAILDLATVVQLIIKYHIFRTLHYIRREFLEK